jgi:hypothetical protein
MLIPTQLDVDVEYHMLNGHQDGYVVMDYSDEHDMTMPTALMGVGHHFDEVPWEI